MTRRPRTINYAALARIAGTVLALLAAFYLIAGHFWTALGIVAAMVTCASLAVAIQRGALLDDRDEELARRDREHAADLAAAETERDIANALVEQWRRDARVVVPIRPGVPLQRAATHDHLAEDDAWFDRLYDDQGDLR